MIKLQFHLILCYHVFLPKKEKPVAGIVMLFTSAKLKRKEHFKALTQIGHASAVAEDSISAGHNIKKDHFEISASVNVIYIVKSMKHC